MVLFSNPKIIFIEVNIVCFQIFSQESIFQKNFRGFLANSELADLEILQIWMCFINMGRYPSLRGIGPGAAGGGGGGGA